LKTPFLPPWDSDAYPLIRFILHGRVYMKLIRRQEFRQKELNKFIINTPRIFNTTRVIQYNIHIMLTGIEK
jgi:hypothetical protein